MLVVVIAFLGFSLMLYCLLGGADFGAGVIEVCLPKSDRRHAEGVTQKAIGPVWETNHIWLILAIVILFTAFPKAFAQISITFHVPLLLMLVGIVLRGCAFVFRHYDPDPDRIHGAYSRVFFLSSLLTPLMIGVVSGGLILGRVVVPSSQTTYAQAFLNPWFNPFCFSVGAFTLGIFVFLAATYLPLETRDLALRKRYAHLARLANVFVVIMGILVFAFACLEGAPFFERFFYDPVSILLLGAATLTLLPYWHATRRARYVLARVLAGFQVSAVLFAWFWTQFPILVFRSGAPSLSLYEIHAPEATLRQLVLALVVGMTLILPALAYLLLVFKTKQTPNS